MTEKKKKIFDFDFETNRFQLVKETFQEFKDNPVRFVETLSELGFKEWEVFRELCRNYTYAQLKPYQVLIDMTEKQIGFADRERVEMVFDPPEIKETPSETLEDLIYRRYKYGDVINFLKDRFSYNDLLSDLCGNVLGSEDTIMIRHLLNGKGDK